MKTEIKNIADFPIVLRVDDVAKIMNISRVSAYTLVHSNGFPRKQTGRRLIIPRDAFFNWLNGTSIYSNTSSHMVDIQKTDGDTDSIRG